MLKALELFGITSAGSAVKVKQHHIRKVEARDTFWFLASAVLLCLIFILLMSYLFGVNSYASSGYEMKKMQNNLLQLTEENKKINLKIAEISSVLTIQNDLKNTEFVAVGLPTFLESNQFSQR